MSTTSQSARIQRPTAKQSFSQFKVFHSANGWEVFTYLQGSRPTIWHWFQVSQEEAEWYLRTGAISVDSKSTDEEEDGSQVINMFELDSECVIQKEDTEEIRFWKARLKIAISNYMELPEQTPRDIRTNLISRIEEIREKLKKLKEQTRKPLSIQQFEQEMNSYDDSSISPLN